ncbi:FeoA domain-containing protein [Candidatus Berkiella aquae]|nr:FeoA family protein [Candidatus Berkiella aquae]
MLTLNTVPMGQPVRVLRFHQQSAGFRHKLLAMGLTPGVIITIIRVAPLGDPIQVKLRGYTLSLRKRECQQIEVEAIHGSSQECVATHQTAGNHCACRKS